MKPELFESIVNACIKLETQPCWSCPAQPGKCTQCAGIGRYKQFTGSQIAKFSLEDFQDLECERCVGSGICSFCNGQLVIVPDEYSKSVVCDVLQSVITALIVSRDDDRFSDMNYILDTAFEWLKRGWGMSAPETPEQIEKTLEAFGISSNDLPDVRKTSSALSEDELRELGLLDNEGKT